MSNSSIALTCSACFVFLVALIPTVGLGATSQLVRESTTARKAALEIGEEFLSARARIVAQGWKPIRMHEKDGYVFTGSEKRLAERKIYEVDFCSIDAGSNCIFYYRKRRGCLRIDTVGEQVKEMKITRWTGECPLTK